MKKTISLLLVLFALNGYAQSGFKGKWYTFSCDMIKVIEYDFEETTLSMNNLDWKMGNLPTRQMADVLKIVHQNNNIYYLLRYRADTNSVKLAIFSPGRPDSSFVQYSVSPQHAEFTTVAGALAFISVDTFERIGLTAYSEQKMNRLKTVKAAPSISRAAYKEYLQRLVGVNKYFKTFFSSHTEGLEGMYFVVYFPNKIRTILASLGYNPLLSDQDIQALNDKFRDDKELVQLQKEANDFGPGR